MTNAQRAHERRELIYHLDRYRSGRRAASLHSLRKEEVPESVRQEIGFHAQGVAEALDRMDGRTR